jgi:hypothetical protein
MKNLVSKLDKFGHTFNPQHVYCRLVDLKEYGITKKYAKEITKEYEKLFYKPLMEKINGYTKILPNISKKNSS